MKTCHIVSLYLTPTVHFIRAIWAVVMMITPLGYTDASLITALKFVVFTFV